MKSMPKENLALHLDKWDIYKLADFAVAFILVVVSMVSADIPRQRIEIVRKPAPYVARGWTPSGEQLNLPLRATPLPTPAASYGPPPEPQATTTEEPATTTEGSTENAEAQKSENLEEAPKKENVEKLEEPQGQYYVVLPQGQNIVYTIPRSAALVAATPAVSFASSSVFTPFSASYIQIYQ